MNLGSAFLNHARGKVPAHLWFAISNPTGANRIAIVNISSDNDGIEDLPIFEAGHHPWPAKQSYVRTFQARLAPLVEIHSAFANHLLAMKEPLTMDVLTKLQKDVHSCRHTPLDVRRVLEEQDFI